MRKMNIEIDEKLVEEAMKLTRKKTIKDVVNYALEELVRKRRRRKLLKLEGKVKWDSNLSEIRQSKR